MRTITEENSREFRMLLAGIAALLYVISPLDLMPGIPFDDVAAIIIAILVAKGGGN